MSLRAANKRDPSLCGRRDKVSGLFGLLRFTAQTLQLTHKHGAARRELFSCVFVRGLIITSSRLIWEGFITREKVQCE